MKKNNKIKLIFSIYKKIIRLKYQDLVKYISIIKSVNKSSTILNKIYTDKLVNFLGQLGAIRIAGYGSIPVGPSSENKRGRDEEMMDVSDSDSENGRNIKRANNRTGEEMDVDMSDAPVFQDPSERVYYVRDDGRKIGPNDFKEIDGTIYQKVRIEAGAGKGKDILIDKDNNWQVCNSYVRKKIRMETEARKEARLAKRRAAEEQNQAENNKNGENNPNIANNNVGNELNNHNNNFNGHNNTQPHVSSQQASNSSFSGGNSLNSPIDDFNFDITILYSWLNLFGVPTTTLLIVSYKIYTLPSASLHPGWRCGFAYLVIEWYWRILSSVWHNFYNTILEWWTLLNQILEYKKAQLSLKMEEKDNYINEWRKKDVPVAWGLYFQDGASPSFEGIVDLHNRIMFYLVVILFGVTWIMLSIMWNFNKSSNTLVYRYLNHGTLIELIWTVGPALVLVAIAFPSFKLLYLMDKITLSFIYIIE